MNRVLRGWGAAPLVGACPVPKLKPMRSHIKSVKDVPFFPFIPFVPVALLAVSLAASIRALARIRRLEQRVNANGV
jgi:hypothetical protein